MEILSVREFKNVCDALSLKKFIFYSENQSWDRVENTIKIRLTFTTVLVAFNPNAICLKSEENSICFDRVKSVRMLDNESGLGVVFTIICGDSGNNLNDVSYTIIAR